MPAITAGVKYRRITRHRQAGEGAQIQGTHSGLALPGTGSQVTGRARIRWAVTASVTGMPSWVAGMALVPLNARLQERNQHLAQGAARTPAHCHTQNQLICARPTGGQAPQPTAQSRRSEIVRAKDNVPVYSGA